MGDETKDQQDQATQDAAVAKADAAVYVVQRLVKLPDGMEANAVLGALTDAEVWVDVGTVKLPRKSMRRSAIKAALENAGIKPDPKLGALKLRVLDAESARVHEVPVVVAEPRFGI